MRPLVLSTINSRHWNANRTYLQLLSCTEMPAPPSSRALLLGGGSRPPQQQSAAAGGGSRPPQQQSAAAGGGVGHDFRCAGGVASNVRPLLVGSARGGRLGGGGGACFFFFLTFQVPPFLFLAARESKRTWSTWSAVSNRSPHAQQGWAFFSLTAI